VYRITKLKKKAAKVQQWNVVPLMKLYVRIIVMVNKHLTSLWNPLGELTQKFTHLENVHMACVCW
jgi:hypothetical protein